MKVSIARPEELGATELDAWRGFQRGDPSLGNPFLAPEFTIAVARHRPSARVAILEDGEGIAGFFPYEVRGRVIGKAIGAGISDCQGMIHRPGLEWDPLALVRACRLPVWEYDHLVGDQHPFAPHHRRRLSSPIMELAGGYAAYVERQNQATGIIKQTLRKQRKLEREIGELRFEWVDGDPAAISTLIRWKSAQYQSTGQPDRFATPWIAATVRDLLHSPSPECRGTLSLLYAGDRPIAAHLGLRSSSVLAYWFPAYDPDAGQYSAGIALCLRMAEAAAAEGIRHIDLGKGESRYKESLKNQELTVCEGRVVGSWPVGTVRRVQLTAMARLRHNRLGRRVRTGG